MFILGRRVEKLREVVKESNNKIKFYKCDINDEKNIDEIISDIGTFDIIVNCAGIISTEEECDTFDKKELNDIIDTNLKSTIMVSLKVIDLWKKNNISGNIINIGSISAKGSKFFPIYASSKAGIIAFTKSIASRYGANGIRCNVISPGVIRTPMSYIETPNFDDYIKDIEISTPLQRLGKPDDIAEIVEFLISDKSSFITGQEIVVDVGYSLSKE